MNLRVNVPLDRSAFLRAIGLSGWLGLESFVLRASIRFPASERQYPYCHQDRKVTDDMKDHHSQRVWRSRNYLEAIYKGWVR